MAKCQFNSQEAGNLLTDKLLPHIEEEAPQESDLRNEIKAFIKDVLIEQYEIDDLKEVIDTIIGCGHDLGFGGMFPNLFSSSRLEKYIQDAQSGVQEDVDKLDTSADKVGDPETVKHRKDSSIKFLDNVFGLARNVRDYYVAQHDMFLFDALFINRGNIEMAELGPVQSDLALCENIRAYKEILFDRIKQYLLTLPGLDAATVRKLKTTDLYALVDDGVGGRKRVYTGILEDIEGALKTYLSVSVLNGDGKGELLRTKFREGFDRFSTDYVRKRNAERMLDAYVAYHMLTNFDSYLLNKLGKSLNVRYHNLLSGENKYSTAKSTSNLLTTWRDNEDINVELEADKVTKMLIATTRVHKWGDWSKPLGSQYLHFNDFECIVSKVKDIAYNPEASSIIFDYEFETTYGKAIFNSFSDETKELIRGKSLREVISQMRQNPRKYTHVIFDILTSQEFYDRYKEIIYKNYSADERNKLFTIGTQIFGIMKPAMIGGQRYGYHNTSSIYELAKTPSMNDYYGYVTQTVDSIFKVDYVQYYMDRQTGLIHGRTLYDSTLYKRLREVSEAIRTANSAKRSKNLNLWEKDLQLTPITQSSSTAEGKPITIFKGISFVIPNSDITVKVYKSSGDVFFYNKSGERIEFFTNLIRNQAVNDFLRQTLRLDLENNPDFLNTLGDLWNGVESSFHSLLDMAARSTMLKYVGYKVPVKEASEKHLSNGNIINKAQYGSKETTIEHIFGTKSGVKYNWDLDEIDTLHPKDVITMKLIALTKSNLSGDATSSVIRDGKGNAQSKNTLSRLLGAIMSQFDLIERMPDSATRDSIILLVGKNPTTGKTESIFQGVYTAKEFDSGDNTKDMRMFTTSEMAISNFFFDYVAGLNTLEDGSLVGNGIVMFLPSVNSDKSTIGRIKINLNVEVDGVKLRDMNPEQIRRVIAKEFATTYFNILDKVRLDWALVDELINDMYPDFNARLTDGYKDGFATFNRQFWDYKLATDENGLLLHPNFAYTSPVDFIKAVVLSNNAETNTPIELIDLVHFINLKGELAFNRTLISQVARFDPTTSARYGIDVSLYPTMDEFFKRKNKEFLRSALKSKFRISSDNLGTTAKTDKAPDIDYLKSINGDWFNRSGKMILARYHVDVEVNGQIYPLVIDITSEADLYKTHTVKIFLDGKGTTVVKDNSDPNNVHAATFTLAEAGRFEQFFSDPEVSNHIELNPILELYNLFDYLFTQSFMNATVGSFIAHPAKGSFESVLEEEAARFLAQHKRNVQFTAAMHEFQLNLLNGIPEDYNIAVIDDIHDDKHTFGGESNDIKPFDGATYVNPFIVFLENYALGGAKAGITKKQFVHYKNGSTGTSGIIKTAGFGMTNDWIRNSHMMQLMMRKMTDRVWRDLFGNEMTGVNIFKDYNGNPVSYSDIFMKVGDKYYERTLEWDEGSKSYVQSTREVSKTGTPLGEWDVDVIEINSNYQLWNAFGGMNSASLERPGSEIKYSDDSITNVVKAMNNVGYRIAQVDVSRFNLKSGDKTILSFSRRGDTYFVTLTDGVETSEMAILPSEIEELVGTLELAEYVERLLTKLATTLSDVYQVLKHSDIHYMPTAGAVKQGAANINSAQKFYDEDADLDYQVIKMYQAGIQLDKEHHADDAELSLMTQVISACAARGFTFEQAAGLYDALRRANELNLDDHYEALALYLKGESIPLRDIVIKTIVDNLGNSQTGNGNFAELISRDILERAKKGEEISFAAQTLPLSDNTVYSKIFSIVTSYLTKSGIKLKIPGVLAVLSPSYDNFKLHNNKKLESFATEEDLLKEQERVVPHYSNEFEFTGDESEYRGYPIVYQADILEDVAIQDGIIYINPGVVKARHEESLANYDINPDVPRYSSQREYLKRRLIEVTLHDKNGLDGAELQEQADRCMDMNSSHIEIDRTYHITEQISAEELQEYINNAAKRVLTAKLNHKEEIVNVVHGVDTTFMIRVTTPRSPNLLVEIVYNPDHNRFDARFIPRSGNYSDIILGSLEQLLTGEFISPEQSLYIADRYIPRELQEYFISGKFEEDETIVLREGEKFKERNPRATIQDVVNYENRLKVGSNAYLRDNWGISFINEYTNETNFVERSRREYIQTPKQYKALKKLVDLGIVTNVTEDIVEGRNLGAYNVRGRTKDGKQFQMWDLDSASAAFDLDANKKQITYEFANSFMQEYFGISLPMGVSLADWYNQTKIRVTRWLQSDLANLSPSQENAIALFERFLLRLKEKRESGSSEQDLMQWEIAWANVKQGRSDGIYYRVGDDLLEPTPDNWQKIRDQIKIDLLSNSRVRINGTEYEIDKESLKYNAYEIIMPKRFKTDFGLDTYADLQEISKDKYYFLREYARKSLVEVDNFSLFTVALKRHDGKHILVLDRSQLPVKGLHKVRNSIENIIDGKRIRFDAEGNEMYQMQRAGAAYGDGQTLTEEDAIYVDNSGHEIIVTDNVAFYAKNLHYDDIQISQNLTSVLFEKAMKDLGTVKKKLVTKFLKRITKGGRLTIAKNFAEINAINYDIISEHNMFDPKYHHIMESMLEKHTSFLRSLDIVAARIPAQSMQSFMPMRVVAFDNPDLNNAYVSTMLILLLGSDY